MRSDRQMRLQFCPSDVRNFFLDLRSQPTYPLVKGDPLLLLYDLLCVLNASETDIAEWFGVRGYLHVARHRFVQPTQFEQALEAIMEVQDEASGSE